MRALLSARSSRQRDFRGTGGACDRLVVVCAARRLSFADAMTVAFPLGLIASAHGYVYDAVVLIPLFVAAASLRTWTGRLALFGLTPVPYVLILGDTPAGVFIGAACVIAAVVFATIGLYRARGAGSEEWSIKLTPGSAARTHRAT